MLAFLNQRVIRIMTQLKIVHKLSRAMESITAHKKIRIGILGAANIAKKNVHSIISSKHCSIAGIASRNIDKAHAFVNDLNLANIVKVFVSYDVLITSGEVDAIYIPLPTAHHLEWVLKCATSKKHILLEKPAALSLTDLQTMLTASRDNNVMFMDGVMFIHHDRMISLANILQDPYTGNVQRVSSSFSFNGSEEFLSSNIRVKLTGDPFGCLGDLGWYCSLFGLLAINKGVRIMTKGEYKLPLSCIAICDKWSDDGVPLQCHCKVYFSADKLLVLSFDCSFLLPFRQTYEVLCNGIVSKGIVDKIITCDDFVLPRSPYKASFTVESHPANGK